MVQPMAARLLSFLFPIVQCTTSWQVQVPPGLRYPVPFETKVEATCREAPAVLSFLRGLCPPRLAHQPTQPSWGNNP